MKLLIFACLFCLNLVSAQSIATPFPGTTTYPYDFENSTNQPLAEGTIYRPLGGSHTDSSHWGWQCVVTGGPGLAFGGNELFAPDGMLHTRVLQGGHWVRIDSALKAANPLQGYVSSIQAQRELLKDLLSRARYIYFEGRSPSDESAYLADSVNPGIAAVATALGGLAADLLAETGLQAYSDSQASIAATRLTSASIRLVSLGGSVDSAEMADLRNTQVMVETAAEAVDAEPPARALSMIAYDSTTGLFVIFGGDHLDYVTNDLWVFDPAIPQWRERHPVNAPSPRADHWFTPADSGRILLKGGFTCINGWRHVGPAEWYYDVAADRWLNPSGAQARPSGSRSYRSNPYMPEHFMQGEKPSATANEAVLSGIAVNTWVEMDPPFRSGGARDWGSVAYDPNRDMFYVYSGGHCVYSGTDALHYHLATNRYEQPIPTELPLGWVGGSEGANGWSFNLRPWMSGHLWNSYRFHPGLGKMMVIGRQANCCGAPWDTYVYYYNPDRAEWESRQYLDSMPNNCYSVNACYTNTLGMLNWIGDEIWRMNDTTMVWERLNVTGTMPGTSVDFCGISYDSRRDRVLMVTCGGYHNPFDGVVHALDLKTLAVTQLVPANAASVEKAWPLREMVYLPEQDLFLFAASDYVDFDDNSNNSPEFLVYDPTANLWKSAAIGGTCEYGNNSGMFYDVKRSLVWHVNNGWSPVNGKSGNIRVLKIDTSSLVLTTIDRPSSIETALSAKSLSLSSHPNPVSGSTRILVEGLPGKEALFLGIYDIRGKLVNDLTGDLKLSRVIPWNTKDLSAGIYIIRLNAGKRTITHKVPLIK